MKKNFRRLIENNRWLKQVPNTLTIFNSLCGFGAIVYTLHVYDRSARPVDIFVLSAWIILGAMVFDAMDGFTARIFNAASMHGMQMDSLADMVTFGCAPAVLVAVMAHKLRDLKTGHFYIIWGLSAIYFGCAAYRLARYNAASLDKSKKPSMNFAGLPTPAAAAGISTLIIFYGISGEIKPVLSFLPVYAAILGLLMVSNMKYIHAGRWLESGRRNPRRLVLILLMALSLVVEFPLAALLIVNLYIISGPATMIFRRLSFSLEKDEEASATSSGEL